MYHHVFRVSPCFSMNQDFISFYCRIIVHCVDTPHFMYSFIKLMDVWVAFTLGLYVYIALISIHIQVLWDVCFHFSLGMDLWEHMVPLCLIVWGNSKLFSRGLHHFIFPPVVFEGFNFSTVSLTLIICLLDYSHPSGHETASHWSFDLHFLTTNESEHLFMCLLATVIISLWVCLIGFSYTVLVYFLATIDKIMKHTKVKD